MREVSNVLLTPACLLQIILVSIVTCNNDAERRQQTQIRTMFEQEMNTLISGILFIPSFFLLLLLLT